MPVVDTDEAASVGAAAVSPSNIGVGDADVLMPPVIGRPAGPMPAVKPRAFMAGNATTKLAADAMLNASDTYTVAFRESLDTSSWPRRDEVIVAIRVAARL